MVLMEIRKGLVVNTQTNGFGQIIGPGLPDWTPRQPPSEAPMQGRFARLERLELARHLVPLWEAVTEGVDDSLWTYLPFAQPADQAAFADMLSRDFIGEAAKYQGFAIQDVKTGATLGTASFMRTDTASGSTEVGSVLFGPRLQRSPIATEAMFLMMQRVFDEQGYRRYEWKCDSLNTPSWRAAERLGFSYEGTFRQVMVYKGRSRDTAWFSMLDREWPTIRKGFEAWLDPANFDANGQQIDRLRTRDIPV